MYLKGTKLPKIDSIRNTLKVLELSGLRMVNKSIVNKAFRNKVFDKGTIDGYRVAAIDGTKFFGSNKNNCEMTLYLKLRDDAVTIEMLRYRYKLKGE